MLTLVLFTVLLAACLAKPLAHGTDYYTFSSPVGGTGGLSYVIDGDGRITGVRIWERSSSYITGFQLRYGYVWSKVVGQQSGAKQELELFDGEAIIQISGKYQSSFIYQLIFVTSNGRMLRAGQPFGMSFNMYPEHHQAELKVLSGTFSGSGIISLGAHWGIAYAVPEETPTGPSYGK